MHISSSDNQLITDDVYFSQEVKNVPFWVKAILAAGILLALFQLSEFNSSLKGTVQKRKAETAAFSGNYFMAIDLYKDLLGHYRNDKRLIKALGLAQYHAAQYTEALDTFGLLVGQRMPKHDVEEVNKVISDIVEKLNLNREERS